MKLNTFDAFLKEQLLSDPELKKEYDKLNDEFNAIRKQIEYNYKQAFAKHEQRLHEIFRGIHQIATVIKDDRNKNDPKGN